MEASRPRSESERQPTGASWSGEEGHYDVDDGKGNRTRYLPDGTKVDHNNNPIPMSTLGKAVIVGAALGALQTIIESAPVWLPALGAL